MGFFTELKRRNVFRVGITYVLIAWVLLQGADFALDLVGAPNWVIQTLSIIVITGLPIALVIAWAFELTPEGVRRADEVDAKAGTRPKLNAWHYLLMAAVVAGLSWLLYQARSGPEAGLPVDAQTAPDTDAVPQVAPGETPSIAVLPFVNISGDDEQEYFSDGISEELLNVLSRVPGLRVSSRTSSFAFKGVNRNIREIAAILGVSLILEGSVRKSGNEVRITAQLIDTSIDTHIWSDTFDRELDDIFAIQDEISSAIVAALQGALGLEEDVELEFIPATRNLDAYDLYLQAVGLRSVLSRQSMSRRVELLQQAVEVDPEFVRAWIELARVLVYLPSWHHSLDPSEYTAMAREAVGRALALAPADADAHMVLAEILAQERDWSGWLEQLQVFRTLRPEGEAGADAMYASSAETWLGLGYLERTLEVARAGLADQPDNNFLHLMAAMALLDLGRREEAIVHFEQSLLLGYAGGAADQFWEYLDPAHEREAWVASMAMYFQEHEADLLPLLPHLVRVRFASPSEQEAERQRFWKVAAELGYSREELLQASRRWGYRLPPDMLTALGEFQLVADQFWGNSPMFWMWSPALRPFRRSEPFRSNVRSSGMLQFWRDTQWPDLCRPEGPDDFRCD